MRDALANGFCTSIQGTTGIWFCLDMSLHLGCEEEQGVLGTKGAVAQEGTRVQRASTGSALSDKGMHNVASGQHILAGTMLPSPHGGQRLRRKKAS